MNIKCPCCKNMTIYSPENLFRPFCSKRCQTMDTAAWAEEEYRIPTQELAMPSETDDDSWLLS
ncbi:DNA gyrase inhibitor YacG [Pseudobacteriovorax antillogorgiicola]|uniref:Uncharacterized protein n=1 Tax=Pseudobacteriovorax antillogorgiicola TaxID=1513793 RepID=A0A1Y6B7L9_9BACT|nr:DNA gyrase inhibitor YacG [Pseudobacteriovorax antillogorgiicola]TCS59324.1 hypothetical protein EDD56_101231 [Pseudobacteriovorax antillogorgiicola]SME89374.1 hypothetical protein SAMN06296036_101255 [Pseudobacteriovorax antillogorgiicola]